MPTNSKIVHFFDTAILMTVNIASFSDRHARARRGGTIKDGARCTQVSEISHRKNRPQGSQDTHGELRSIFN